MLTIYLDDVLAPVQISNSRGCKVKHPELRNSRMKVASWTSSGILLCVLAFVQNFFFFCIIFSTGPLPQLLPGMAGSLLTSSCSLFSFHLLVGVMSNARVSECFWNSALETELMISSLLFFMLLISEYLSALWTAITLFSQKCYSEGSIYVYIYIRENRPWGINVKTTDWIIHVQPETEKTIIFSVTFTVLCNTL